MQNPGIYILENQVNGKKYVGKDRNLPNRSKDHLKGRCPNSPAIHAAIKKYGVENFSVEIIRYPGISHEALYAVEQWKISQLNTKSPNGYNLTDGGAGIYGYRHSEESKRKMSETSKLISDETRRKMSESHKGKTLSEEHRRKIAQSGIGRKPTEETRRKLSESSKGKRHSEETRRKIGESSKGRYFSPETRRKRSENAMGEKNPNYGKKATAETRQKISRALSRSAARKKKKCYWMYILTVARVRYESHDYLTKQSQEFFGKEIPDMDYGEQLTFI